MERPDDAVIRIHVEIFALIRRLLPIAILVGSFAGPMTVAEPRVAMWYSAALFCVSLFVLWTLEGLPLYPAHTFGLEYRFEDRPLESGTQRCVHCERVIDDGVHRRYARQVVILGVPLYTLAWGSNDICRDCLGIGAGAGRAPGWTQHPDAGRARHTVGDAGRGPTSEYGTVTAEATVSRSNSTPAGGAATVDETDPNDWQRDDSGSGPGTEIARRVDLSDRTAALEVERAFEDGRP
ncbi:hypothetical protein Htur_1339 [Haloterrigena turkmenica DSM 5511]|uniref:DUF8108 domain-containing protein n=1 Tax=Haloterrigena turkmenica (strain ATCC 51198 / DSM 5511 / JCM 9101 / NCIMB 13204 / VKM B-1734 / 4k) TaxID=543526 RepID=D2RPW8_HALTV|nr:hypothetical protein [Haloterrigena turkmenica]ADB60227.1 hypothetical protein Htur_1339 [Haloterrigena turkmenica DSM 5511]